MRTLKVLRKGNHMRLRNIAMAAAALTVPAVFMIVGTAPSEAATATTSTTFAGTLSGNLSGSITITPGITLSASAGTIKFRTTATLHNLVASKGLTQKGVTITAAKVSSVVMAPAGTSCVTLESSGLPSSSLTTRYTATGGTASDTHFAPGSTAVATGPPITATLGGAGTTTGGSFKNGAAGSAASTAKLILDDTESQLLAACESGTGLTSIKFTGVNGKSTFTYG